MGYRGYTGTCLELYLIIYLCILYTYVCKKSWYLWQIIPPRSIRNFQPLEQIPPKGAISPLLEWKYSRFYIIPYSNIHIIFIPVCILKMADIELVPFFQGSQNRSCHKEIFKDLRNIDYDCTENLVTPNKDYF